MRKKPKHISGVAQNSPGRPVGNTPDSPGRPARAAAPNADSLPYIVTGVCAILGAVLAFWLLCAGYGDYMHKEAQLNFFSFGSDYWHECMAVPGGVLVWASTLLTCTLDNAATGAAVTTLTLMLLWWAVCRALDVSPRWRPALAFVPALVLLWNLNLGYAALTLKSPGFPFILPLGLLSALALYRVYRLAACWDTNAHASTAGKYARLLKGAAAPAVAVAIALTYPWLGCFALLAAAMAAVTAVATAARRRQMAPLLTAALALAALWLFPGLWFSHAGGDLPMVDIWRTPLPHFLEGEEALELPVQLLAALMPVLALIPALKGMRATGSTRRSLMAGTVTGAALFAAAVVTVATARWHDANYTLTLGMDRALAEERWDDAIAQYKALDQEPTRLNNAMAYMAMLHRGDALDSLFSLPVGSAPYDTPRAQRVMHEVGAPVISYHAGLIPFAYRWNMEYMVEYGRGAGVLEMLARCATLNGEDALARKYTDALASIPGQAARAKGLAAPTPADKYIGTLADSRDGFTADNGYFEGYLWPWLAQADPSDRDSKNRLTLAAALICQDQEALAGAVRAIYPQGAKLPRHVAEAVLLWDNLRHDNLAESYTIDQAIRADFNRFLEIYSRNKAAGPERLAFSLKDRYGDTYWYYYTCTETLEII